MIYKKSLDGISSDMLNGFFVDWPNPPNPQTHLKLLKNSSKMALPYTSFCIEHTDTKDVPTDRPVEEQMLLPPVDNSFSGRDDKDDIHDYEDTFQVVAKYGTSETPSDFEGNFDNYDDLYEDPEEIAVNDEWDSYHISETDELTRQVSIQEVGHARKFDYLED